jgi:hypothetical protein
MSMKEICRVCMEIASSPINIYKTMVLDDVVANLMIECADIEVCTGDGCPEIICVTCLTSLEVLLLLSAFRTDFYAKIFQHAYSFQKQIKRADNILKELADQAMGDDDGVEAIKEIEIERMDYKYEYQINTVADLQIEETKPVITKKDDDDDGGMPRWTLPIYAPTQSNLLYCCMCTETFETRQLRQQHAADVHHISPHKPLYFQGRLTHSCTVCREVAFTSATALDSHLKSKMTILCSECGKPFNRSTIYKHMKVHERQKQRELIPKAEKEFVSCQICGKSILAEKMNEHLERHMNVKCFECAHCAKTFTRKR